MDRRQKMDNTSNIDMTGRTNFVELGSASSLLTDLILETGGQSTIGEAELFVIRNINIPALPKSWIVFQSLGLRDTATRGEIAKGFQHTLLKSVDKLTRGWSTS